MSAQKVDDKHFCPRVLDVNKYKMGNADTKLVFRKAVVQLTSKTQVSTIVGKCIKWLADCYVCYVQTISAEDNDFWDQFWSENVTNVQDVFTLVPAAEIRLLREDVPANLATLCYKAVEKFVKAVENSCRTQQDQNTGGFLIQSISYHTIILRFLYYHIFLCCYMSIYVEICFLIYFQFWIARVYWPEFFLIYSRSPIGKTYSGLACQLVRVIRPYH